MPWQALYSVLAHCDSGEVGASVDDSCYGVASPQSCLLSLSPVLFSLAPPLAQLVTPGVLTVSWNSGHHPSPQLSMSLKHFLAQRELELNPVWLLVGCSQSDLDKWQESLGLCQSECWSP